MTTRNTKRTGIVLPNGCKAVHGTSAHITEPFTSRLSLCTSWMRETATVTADSLDSFLSVTILGSRVTFTSRSLTSRIWNWSLNGFWC